MRIGRNARDRGEGTVTVAFWAIVLAMLPGVLDQTILATALPTIASGLGRLALLPCGANRDLQHLRDGPDSGRSRGEIERRNPWQPE